MKKRLFILTIVLCLLCANTVFAAEDTQLDISGDTATCNVNYTADTGAFIVSVPLSVTLGNTDTRASITATQMNLRPEECVEVEIASGLDSAGKIQLSRKNSVTAGSTETSIYRKSGSTKIEINNTNKVVARFEDGTTPTTNLYGDMYFTTISNPTELKPGDYTGVVTFKVTKKNK